MASGKQQSTKFVGQINWFGGPNNQPLGPEQVVAFQRTQGQLVLGCDSRGWKYNIALTSMDGIRFTGTFEGRQGLKKSPVDVVAKLYTNAEGCLIFGSWVEDDYEYAWYAELQPVEVLATEDES